MAHEESRNCNTLSGTLIRFADREPIEQILKRASSSHYGVRSLIHELVQSELFLNK